METIGEKQRFVIISLVSKLITVSDYVPARGISVDELRSFELKQLVLPENWLNIEFYNSPDSFHELGIVEAMSDEKNEVLIANIYRKHMKRFRRYESMSEAGDLFQRIFFQFNRRYFEKWRKCKGYAIMMLCGLIIASALEIFLIVSQISVVPDVLVRIFLFSVGAGLFIGSFLLLVSSGISYFIKGRQVISVTPFSIDYLRLLQQM